MTQINESVYERMGQVLLLIYKIVNIVLAGGMCDI